MKSKYKNYDKIIYKYFMMKLKKYMFPFPRCRWIEKQQADIAMLEGLSASPPRREVLPQLNAAMKNFVRRRVEELHGDEGEGGGEGGGESGGEGTGDQTGEESLAGGSGDQGISTEMSEVERVHRTAVVEEDRRRKKRKRSLKETGIEGKIIPTDLVRRMAAIFLKHEMSRMAVSDVVASFYRECDCDLDDVILSPTTAQRSRVF